MELRDYQRRCLKELTDYFKLARTHGTQAMGAKTAFVVLTDRPYRDVPGMEQMPYVCLRVPTGGGKTLLACHAIDVVAQHYLQTPTPTVLWLAPSNAIVSQTLSRLRDRSDPYRKALDEEFGARVCVMDLDEARSVTFGDLTGAACVIVTTFQSLRVDNTEGRKVYEDSGGLMSHFDNLNSMMRAQFSDGATGELVRSLANVLMMRRPMVIMDEAHNARTPLSFATLTRFNPSAIVELSATPERKHDPARELYASNILAHVSALELKVEDMIKLPIRLKVNSDWRLVVRDALDTRRKLEEQASLEREATGEYIRPIILFQAQSVNGDDVNVDVLRQALIEDFQVPEANIATHTGSNRGLDGIDVASERCPITCIITVKALVEGWDCPFAYVLCSLSGVSTPRAVEQVLGRVLRLPKAKRKVRDALNCAYAFAASDNFIETAKNLRDALVEGCGFQKLEADDLVIENTGATPGLFDRQVVRVTTTPDLSILNDSLRSRVTFEPARQEIVVTGPVSAEEVRQIATTLPDLRDRADVVARIMPERRAPRASAVDQSPMVIPGLAVRTEDGWSLFDETHLLNVPWDLAICDASLNEQIFPSNSSSGATGEIDVTQSGRIEMSGFVPQLHRDLSMFGLEPGWTPDLLTGWLLPKVRQADILPSSLRSFVRGVLDGVLRERNWAIDRLASEKYRLAESIELRIAQHRNEKRAAAYQQCLFDEGAEVRVSSDHTVVLDPARYAPNWYYDGHYHFAKHVGRVGELKPDGEEFECAAWIDRHPLVKRWVRNIDRRERDSFWLQTSTDRFYPDFVCELEDGRWLVVESKGHVYWSTDDSREKRRLGELWADRSEGKCIFVMPDGPNWQAIEAAISQ